MAIMVPAVAGKIINIGHAGENLATTVVFDVSDWIKPVGEGGFGSNGSFTLIIQQGGGSFYSQTTIDTSETGKVKWPVDNVNTSVVGLGKCELRYEVIDNEVSIVVKSIIYDFVVTNSLDIGANQNIPDVVVSWLDQISTILAEATSAEAWATGEKGGVPVSQDEPQYENNALWYSNLAQQYGNLTVGNTTTGEPGSNANVSIQRTQNGWELTFTIPRGNTGSTGATGETGPRGSKWYVNNTNYSSIIGMVTDDQYLNASNGDTFKYNGSSWVLTGNIRGPQGHGLEISGTRPTAEDLPTPASSHLNEVYIVGNNPGYYYYPQKNELDQWVWVSGGIMGGLQATLYDWT